MLTHISSSIESRPPISIAYSPEAFRSDDSGFSPHCNLEHMKTTPASISKPASSGDCSADLSVDGHFEDQAPVTAPHDHYCGIAFL